MNQNNSSGVESDQKPAREDAAARWRKVIEQQRESGLPVSAYCRERGVSAASFFAWRRRLVGAAGAAEFKPVKLVSEARRACGAEAKSRRVGIDSAIELCLTGERRLIVRREFDRDLLIELIRTLEAAP
jgi:hypothetical protein